MIEVKAQLGWKIRSGSLLIVTGLQAGHHRTVPSAIKTIEIFGKATVGPSQHVVFRLGSRRPHKLYPPQSWFRSSFRAFLCSSDCKARQQWCVLHSNVPYVLPRICAVLLRPIPITMRQQSSVATLEALGTEQILSQPAEATEKEDQPPEFSSLQNDLHPGVYRALTQGPFQLKTMSPVQAAVLPLLPELTQPYNPDNPSSRDLMVKAKTGTGKTLGFLIPAVEARLKTLQSFKTSHKNEVQERQGRFNTDPLQRFASSHAGILIISPTRELATQIANEASKLVQHLKGIEVHLFVGGEDRRRQIKNFNYGRADIVVATPGRMNDLLESSERVSGSIAHTQTVCVSFLVLSQGV